MLDQRIRVRARGRWHILALVAAASMVVMPACNRSDSNASTDPGQKSQDDLATQLRNLQSAGIRLRPGRSLSALRDAGRDPSGPGGYAKLLAAIAEQGLEGAEPAWTDDISRIELEGIRKKDCEFLAARIRRMAKGALPLSDIQVVSEYPKVWLRFSVAGAKKQVRLLGEGPALADSVLKALGRLLSEGRADIQLYRVNLSAGECLIGCATRAQLGHLKKLGVEASVVR